MSDPIEQIPYRQTVFAVFVLFVFGTSAAEIVIEFAAGETLGSIGDDLSRFAISAVVLAFFFYEYLAQRRALGELRGQLNKARGQLALLDIKSKKLASQFRVVMQKQSDVWRLTSSQHYVVIGMLKGLSFREIAELRQTREKTVRQQASYTMMMSARRRPRHLWPATSLWTNLAYLPRPEVQPCSAGSYWASSSPGRVSVIYDFCHRQISVG